MAKQRSTFAKIQRERAKQEKAAAKRDRRVNGPEPVEGEDEDAQPGLSEDAVAAGLARLHAAYENGELSLEEFDARREELQARLIVE